jgi:dynein heavy chain 1
MHSETESLRSLIIIVIYYFLQIDEGSIAENLPEQEILVQSVCETMVPKLVAEDIPLLFSLLSDVFPGVSYTR